MFGLANLAACHQALHGCGFSPKLRYNYHCHSLSQGRPGFKQISTGEARASYGANARPPSILGAFGVQAVPVSCILGRVGLKAHLARAMISGIRLDNLETYDTIDSPRPDTLGTLFLFPGTYDECRKATFRCSRSAAPDGSVGHAKVTR